MRASIQILSYIPKPKMGLGFQNPSYLHYTVLGCAVQAIALFQVISKVMFFMSTHGGKDPISAPCLIL